VRGRRGAPVVGLPGTFGWGHSREMAAVPEVAASCGLPFLVELPSVFSPEPRFTGANLAQETRSWAREGGSG
jgi:hypothetical protein